MLLGIILMVSRIIYGYSPVRRVFRHDALGCNGQRSRIIGYCVVALCFFSGWGNGISSFFLPGFTVQCIRYLICSEKSTVCGCQFRVCVPIYFALIICSYGCRLRCNSINPGDTSTVVAFSRNRYVNGLYVYKVFCVIAYLIVASFCQRISLFVCDSRCPFMLLGIILMVSRIIYGYSPVRRVFRHDALGCNGQRSRIIGYCVVALCFFSGWGNGISSFFLPGFTVQCIRYLICSEKSTVCGCQFRICVPIYLALIVCGYGYIFWIYS